MPRAENHRVRKDHIAEAAAVRSDRSRILSTYRLQLTPDLGFREAGELLDYLDALGVTTVYSSPVFGARMQSRHGYDVTSTLEIRKEFGTEDDFRKLTGSVHRRGMTWMQGIVPNHMAFDAGNTFLSDILELGGRSRYRNFFDIDWNSPVPALKGRVLAPFLGGGYEEELSAGRIRLEADGGLFVNCGGFRLPLSLESYGEVMRSVTGGGKRRVTDTKELKRAFQAVWRSRNGRRALQQRLDEINSSPDLLDGIISRQHFLLRRWDSSSCEINYRRFFAVNDLIALRTEDLGVFRQTHALVEGWIREGVIDGIRVDHVDGLRDPEQYLTRLRKISGGRLTLVEKILGPEEKLRSEWEADGTTGYDFLHRVNSLFVDSSNEGVMRSICKEMTAAGPYTPQSLSRLKKETAMRLFGGDLDNLASLFLDRMKDRPYGRDMTRAAMTSLLAEVCASFRNYRSYLRRTGRCDVDYEEIERAIEKAAADNGELTQEASRLKRFLLDYRREADSRECFMRMQQLTPAVMAKSFEDTLFFRDSLLISLNEVGSDPAIFGTGVEDFHRFIGERSRNFPFSMNTTSTHDTKMGEDVRARIDVLSEMAAEWGQLVRRWRRENAALRKEIGGRICPSDDEEYYIYQLLAGSMPFTKEGLGKYGKRLDAHAVKWLREAGVNTSWEAPSREWESGCIGFIHMLLEGGTGGFGKSFGKLLEFVSFHGFLNSMSITTLKMMCPGIPDTYQGSESWNLSLVDPDNRRPVDFKALKKSLGSVPAAPSASILRRMTEGYRDGRAKLFLTRRLLSIRREMPELLLDGDYIPLGAYGPRKDRLVSFARRLGDMCMIVTVPRLTGPVALEKDGVSWKGCGSTGIMLPEGFPWLYRDMIVEGGRHEAAGGKGLPMTGLLKDFPISVILSDRAQSTQREL